MAAGGELAVRPDGEEAAEEVARLDKELRKQSKKIRQAKALVARVKNEPEFRPNPDQILKIKRLKMMHDDHNAMKQERDSQKAAPVRRLLCERADMAELLWESYESTLMALFDDRLKDGRQLGVNPEDVLLTVALGDESDENGYPTSVRLVMPPGTVSYMPPDPGGESIWCRADQRGRCKAGTSCPYTHVIDQRAKAALHYAGLVHRDEDLVHLPRREREHWLWRMRSREGDEDELAFSDDTGSDMESFSDWSYEDLLEESQCALSTFIDAQENVEKEPTPQAIAYRDEARAEAVEMLEELLSLLHRFSIHGVRNASYHFSDNEFNTVRERAFKQLSFLREGMEAANPNEMSQETDARSAICMEHEVAAGTISLSRFFEAQAAVRETPTSEAIERRDIARQDAVATLEALVGKLRDV
eukprot:Hpha_TRINITY_DN19613_c0_g1::TRINITY_DN19613_c0_g1_i1::g.186110::m.186110